MRLSQNHNTHTTMKWNTYMVNCSYPFLLPLFCFVYTSHCPSATPFNTLTLAAATTVHFASPLPSTLPKPMLNVRKNLFSTLTYKILMQTLVLAHITHMKPPIISKLISLVNKLMDIHYFFFVSTNFLAWGKNWTLSYEVRLVRK